jgi:uncharacterized membrane protein HdeD (DUF308 family)
MAALGTPFLPGRLAFLVLGLLILIFGLLQNFAGFALRDIDAAGSWFSRGGASILTGLLLIAMPNLTFAGLAILLGLSWVISGISEVREAIRDREQADWHWTLVDGCVSVALGLAIAFQWPVSGIVSVGLFVGLRCMSVGWSLVWGAPQVQEPAAIEATGLHPDRRLGLAPHPHVEKLCHQLASELAIQRRSDRNWTWLFMLTFYCIHAARMDIDWNLVGMLSPAGAVAGDIALAILLAYGIVAPLWLAWRRATRRIERRAWNTYLSRLDDGKPARLGSGIVRWWLIRRLRSAVRRSEASGSPTAALGWGLQMGLPAVAILMALTPLWGVSWFFDTETWVTGAWELWAEQRTDAWRVNMIQAVKHEYGPAAEKPDFFRVYPDGLAEATDFSFVVIGDPGEGDASQHILRDQLLLVGQKPEVKFLVLSSDVIYPSGATKDYEPKFYLPFKGFNKPIYAVPGNHDWYDALESFAANFLEPAAARAAMRGRRLADLKLTTTTQSRIDGMIDEAQRLRTEYQLIAAQQRAPYFEILTDQFSLIAVDTGILRRVDDDQTSWLEGALERAGDRFKMVILGHPLYAAGNYQAGVEEDFARVHRLLRKHAVDVVMGGDTHDFEYYKEDYGADEYQRSMYHFVNGGGGAYLSIGTALTWPEQPAVQQCGCYPRADALTQIIEARTPPWKWPLWLWVKHLGAWPSSPEIVASAFDYDHAPFYQSFMEVRVEGSTGTVRYWLYGANGRLRWSDLHAHQDRIPGGQAANDLVEFRFPLRAASR